MPSTFSGLEIGRRALLTSQKALEITSHNMANAGTPGYSRQVPTISATAPYTYPIFNREKSAGQIGTGVDITSINRVRDQLLDDQIQRESSSLGQWAAMRDMLDQVERTLNEPSDSGIRAAVDEFWSAMQDLSTKPNDTPTRAALVQQTMTMTDQIRQSYQGLKTLRSDINDRIAAQVEEINGYAKELAELNDQIGKINIQGDQPNDLLDRRDEVLEKLSSIVNIRTTYDAQNRVTVTVGGRSLVYGNQCSSMITVRNENDPSASEIRWEGLTDPAAREVNISSGSLQGLLTVRDEKIPQMLNNLDQYAKALITNVNSVHQKGIGLDGSTNMNFFEGTGASDIRLAEVIEDNPQRIAASASGASGEGAIALEMAALKQKPILNGNTVTMGSFFAGVIAELGIDSNTAKTKANNQALLIDHLSEKRESISGVSLDEEMTNMIQFQHGYNAAAKIISTMNELLDVIINRLKI